MEKRALIAVALAFIILFAYQFFFMKTEPRKTQQPKQAEQKETPIKELDVTVEPLQAVSPVAQTTKVSLEEKEIKVETDLYVAVFTNIGGTLKRYELKKYQGSEGENVMLLRKQGIIPSLGIGSQDDFNLSDVNFQVSGKDMILDNNNTTASLRFEYKDAGVSVQRSYTFYNDTYKIEIKDEVTGLSDYWITLGSDFGMYNSKDVSMHIGPVLLKDTDRMEFNPQKLKEPVMYKEGLKWIAQEDKYFFASLVPVSKIEEAKIWKYKDSAISAFQGKPGVNNFILYAGPKEYDRLKTLKIGLEHIVDFGFFSIIALPLFWILKVFYNVIGNYGWAIILLTLITRLPFIPLINKSQKSMKKMQEIQPKMAELREKYKKDPQRLQKEMMELYKKHKVNPVGGCLPILLQIPVFFALYKILLIAIELRGAPFMLWIQDLSAPDTLFGHIPASIPLIGGFAVGPLPLLMGVTMVLQQKMTPTSLDPTQNKIMMIMPVVFTFLFLNFASGLVLYWLMNNVFSIIQQFFTNKKLAREKEQS